MNMRTVAKRYLVLPLSFVLLLFAASCSSSKLKPEENSVESAAAAADENLLGDSDSGKAMGLSTIHFSYDSFKLDEENKELLAANVAILQSNPKLRVQIEGHCDQRGGIQYNIALGEHRAKTIEHFLEDKGIDADRLTVISFGKERPIDPEMNELAYSKNRRANFVITSK